MSILVVGGAGYIGSHMVKLLARRGRRAVVLDDLSTGHRDAVHDAELVVGDAADRALVLRLIAEYRVDAVIHFAARTRVDESMADPGLYYRANVATTVALLDAVVAAGVRRFVFSSSAAVYGESEADLIDERHPLRPRSPYGHTKAIVEQVLADYRAAHGVEYVALRYFNAAGADPDGALGERHKPETHLVPIVLDVAAGRRTELTIHGGSYATPDGTCIRDYVHVMDLCAGHVAALDWLAAHPGAASAFNLGSARGYSVREVVSAAERVTGRTIPVRLGPPRAGDPARLVASNERARAELGWTPELSSIDTIVAHAWRWYAP